MTARLTRHEIEGIRKVADCRIGATWSDTERLCDELLAARSAMDLAATVLRWVCDQKYCRYCDTASGHHEDDCEVGLFLAAYQGGGEGSPKCSVCNDTGEHVKSIFGATGPCPNGCTPRPR